jgi:hypothetical protein
VLSRGCADLKLSDERFDDRWYDRQTMSKVVSKFDKIIAGLLILNRHESPQCQAEHGVLYAGCSGSLTDIERSSLEQLGWRWDDKTSSWMVFT